MDRPPAKLPGERLRALAFFSGLQHAGARARFRSRRGVQALHQPAKQLRRIDSQGVRFVECGKRSACVAGKNQFEQPADASTIGEAEHVANLIGGDRAATVRDRLIEDRQPVARRTFRGAGDHRERVRLDLDALRVGDLRKVRREFFRRNSPQVEALAP